MALSDQMAGGADPGGGLPAEGVTLDLRGNAYVGADTGAVVELTVPAHTSFLGVVRTATAGLAARLSFTLDEIEDLRIAVDEACVMLLAPPRPPHTDEATLTCRFRVLVDALAVTVSGRVGPRAV